LLDHGGIDAMIRVLIQEGLPPVEAIRMATLNPAEHYGLFDRGGIAPGRRADLLIVDDLEALAISGVYYGGKELREDGDFSPWLGSPPPNPPPPSMNVDWGALTLEIPAAGVRARVIGVVPHQLITAALDAEPTVRDGKVVADPERDLLKIAVIERHTGSGRAGVGLVSGMGLRTGAMAGTVAHDHHNLIAVGADDESILTAARQVADTGGGLAVAKGRRVLAALALPVGGLMSEEPIERVRGDLDGVLKAVRALGSSLHDPFMAMSFLGLEVIPSLKITDQGLVDVDGFRKVGLWIH